MTTSTRDHSNRCIKKPLEVVAALVVLLALSQPGLTQCSGPGIAVDGSTTNTVCVNQTARIGLHAYLQDGPRSTEECSGSLSWSWTSSGGTCDPGSGPDTTFSYTPTGEESQTFTVTASGSCYDCISGYSSPSAYI